MPPVNETPLSHFPPFHGICFPVYLKTPMTPKSHLSQIAASLHLDACGACSASLDSTLKEQLRNAGPIPFAPSSLEERLDPSALLRDARSFFVILFPYRPASEEEGNIALYARPMDYHKVIHRYLQKIIETARPSYPGEQFLPLVDTSPMVDRWLAYAAGLGFFGRNHCLIHPTYGSFVTIGSILTTLSLTPDEPLTLDCGSCRECLIRCPGRAIGEKRLDPFRCKSYLTQKKEELSPAEMQILQRTPYIFGCDECQRFCPFNQKALPSPLPEIHEHRISTLTKEEMDSYSNRAFDKAFRSYAFAWRGKKVLLRNWNIVNKKDKQTINGSR